MGKGSKVAQSFCLAFRMGSPVSLNHPWLHLDGILAHMAYQRELGREYYNLPTKQVVHRASADGRYHDLLAFRSRVPFASVSEFAPPDLRSLQYYKRAEADGFPGSSIRIAFGHYRNWMLRTVYCPAETVMFWGRGDVALIHDLLGDLTHLGNDTRVGWGRVAGYHLQVIDRAADRSLVHDGRAMRPIPVRLLSRWSEAVPLAWRPPYWAPGNVEICAPPGAEVEWA